MRHSGSCLLRRAEGASHCRACGSVTMSGPVADSAAAFLPTALALLAASAEGFLSAFPPWPILRMRVFIVFSAVSALWLLSTVLIKVATQLLGAFSGALNNSSQTTALVAAGNVQRAQDFAT